MTPEGAPGPRVAYIMSRFPRLTETFILSEILALKADGLEIELYPLLRERAAVVQPETAALVASAHYQPFVSTRILRSNVRLLRHNPRRYLGTLAAVVRVTFGSWNFLVGGLAIFPKVAHNALEMRRTGINHVHCHFANHPALAGLIIRRLVGIPYSFTAHGSDLHMDRRGLATKVREAAFVVAISDYNRRLILESATGAGHKVDVIHCGVRTDLFAPVAKRRNDADGPLSILCIGTLHEVKGQRYLVDACRILKSRGIESRCVFVGEGDDRSGLEQQIADAGLGESVRLLGARTQEEIIGLLRTADVLVAPSVPTKSGKREGIPVVLMEAMSSGVPVIASDLSGIPELVVDGRTGLLARPGDATSIADALERLHASPELRHRLTVGGRERVTAGFDVRSNARTLRAKFDACARTA